MALIGYARVSTKDQVVAAFADCTHIRIGAKFYYPAVMKDCSTECACGLTS